MNHPRTAIRTYIKDLLTEKVKNIGGRVYVNRTDAALRNNLPCINIFNVDEDNEIKSGTKNVVQVYERSYKLQIDCCAEQPNNVDGEETLLDKLDELARQVERYIGDDYFLNKRLDSYNGNPEDDGLASGLNLMRTEFHDVADDEGIVGAQSLIWEILYLDEAFIDYTGRADVYEEYLLQIRRVGSDEDTVDPVLIAAQGDTEDEE